MSLSKHGFTLTELLIVMGVGAIIGLSFLSIQMFAIGAKLKVEMVDWLSETRLSAMRAIQDTGAWNQTLLNNPALQCITANASCAGQAGPIRLLQNDGTMLPMLADPSQPDAGRTLAGQPCTGFTSTLSADDGCALRFEVHWRPLCRDAECRYPQVQIVATVRHKLTPQIQGMRVTQYGFRVVRAERGLPVSASCVSMGGSVVGRDCVFTRPSQCNPGQFLVGFNADGTLICDTVGAFTCPTGSIVNGLDANGNLICIAGCAAGAVSTVIPMGVE